MDQEDQWNPNFSSPISVGYIEIVFLCARKAKSNLFRKSKIEHSGSNLFRFLENSNLVHSKLNFELITVPHLLLLDIA